MSTNPSRAAVVTAFAALSGAQFAIGVPVAGASGRDGDTVAVNHRAGVVTGAVAPPKYPLDAGE